MLQVSTAIAVRSNAAHCTAGSRAATAEISGKADSFDCGVYGRWHQRHSRAGGGPGHERGLWAPDYDRAAGINAQHVGFKGPVEFIIEIVADRVQFGCPRLMGAFSDWLGHTEAEMATYKFEGVI